MGDDPLVAGTLAQDELAKGIAAVGRQIGDPDRRAGFATASLLADQVAGLKQQIAMMTKDQNDLAIARDRNTRLLNMLDHVLVTPIGDHARADMINTVQGMKEQATAEGSSLHHRWVHPEPEAVLGICEEHLTALLGFPEGIHIVAMNVDWASRRLQLRLAGPGLPADLPKRDICSTARHVQATFVRTEDGRYRFDGLGKWEIDDRLGGSEWDVIDGKTVPVKIVIS